MVFLKIRIPKKESKEDKEIDTQQYSASGDFKEVLGVMKHFFESLHSIYSSFLINKVVGQDFLSFEYVVLDEQIDFYCVCPEGLAVLAEKQITGFYPDSFIERVPDYNLFKPSSKVSGYYLKLSNHYKFPFKTYQRLGSDPLNNITNVLSKLQPEEGAAIQIMIRPVKDGWQKKGKGEAKSILEDKKKGLFSSLNPLSWIGTIFRVFFHGENELQETPDAGGRVTPIAEDMAKAIEEKNTQVGYETIVRVLVASDTIAAAKAHQSTVLSGFAQFNYNDSNALGYTRRHSNKQLASDFVMRKFRRTLSLFLKKPMILSAEELASLFHLPNIKYNKAPNINWQNFKIAPPPKNIPKEGLLLGHNQYRGKTTEIRMKNEDRFRHFYVVGQTGTGKSSILQVMIRQDLSAGKGICVVDPHGQLIDDILPFIPKERADDVIFFNPADVERPIGLNLLEAHDEEEMDLVALDAMNIMIKMFDEEVFGPRIQDYFRNGCLTLMAHPNGGALTDIVRLFTDDAFQKERVSHVKNPVVKSFWTNQMAKTGQREKQEMIPYFAAKFGAFVTNGLMRNIIGQTKSAFNFFDAMDTNKILMINLSKGEVGDVNSKLLGMIIVAKVQQAALRRQKQAKEDRKDFYMYIDEFQNYVTDSIEVILSEARKYRLSLNMAHQYLAQLEGSGGGRKGKEVNVKDTIFGNVGSIMAYKIGAQDAEYMAKEMAPVFTDQDLINVDKYKAVMKLSIDTQPSRPFSIIPVNPYTKKGDQEAAEAFKQLSRLKYGREKEFVEREIFRRLGVNV